MPTPLPKLDNDTKEALGKNTNLVNQYEDLRTLDESLIDNPKAQHYLDATIRRLQAIISTNPASEELKKKRDSFILALTSHSASILVLSSSKPAEAVTKLKEMKIEGEPAQKVVSLIEQAGCRHNRSANEVEAVCESVTAITNTVLTCSGEDAINTHPHHHCHHRG